MKKTIIISLIALLFTSCSDNFLDLSPKSNSTAANFYKTEDDFTMAINGCYERLRGVYDKQGYLMGEMRSDNTHYTRYKPDRGIHILYRENIADFVVDDQNDWVRNMWEVCYAGISRTNTVISRIEKTSLSDNFKNKIIGEARFLRAFYYFQLVQCFGRVPLQLEEVTNEGNAFPEQASNEDVYKAIISDITDAIDKLPAVAFSSGGFSTGAATKGAAKMLYAYVLMTQPTRDYATAETLLREIMNMGYELVPNYADVFDTSKKNSKEHIFSVQYQMGDQGQQSSWLYDFIPKTKEAKIITGVEMSSTLLSAGWNVPTPEMISSYEKGDLRINPSIAYAVGELQDEAMVVEAVLNVGDSKIANYNLAIPFINKYRHVHAKINNTDDNWPVYRYADALLLLAECLVEQGRASEATPYVNQVRQRAGLPNLNSVDASIVANERRHELAFENHRWFDLIRTGKAVEVMTAYGKYIKTIDPELPDRTYQIKSDYLLFPIPYRELQINKNLTQNTGY